MLFSPSLPSLPLTLSDHNLPYMLPLHVLHLEHSCSVLGLQTKNSFTFSLGFSSEVFYFKNKPFSGHELTGNRIQLLRFLLPTDSHKCVSLDKAACTSVEPKTLSLWLLMVPSTGSGSSLDTMSMDHAQYKHLFSGQESCPLLLCLQPCQQHAGEHVGSSSFAKIAYAGHSLMKCPFPLCLCYHPFCRWHVRGQRKSTMFSKRPEEHTAGAPPLSLCAGHFGDLLAERVHFFFFGFRVGCGYSQGLLSVRCSGDHAVLRIKPGPLALTA